MWCQKGFSYVPYGVRNVSGGCQMVSEKVIWCHKSVRKVSDGIRNVSCVFRNVSDGVRKVSGGVRKVSDCDMKVSDCYMQVSYVLWCQECIRRCQMGSGKFWIVPGRCQVVSGGVRWRKDGVI